MNRRGFFGWLAGALAAAWKPKRKGDVITLPKSPLIEVTSISYLNAAEEWDQLNVADHQNSMAIMRPRWLRIAYNMNW